MRDEGSQLRVNKHSLHKRLDDADAYDPLRDNPRSPKPGQGSHERHCESVVPSHAAFKLPCHN